MHCNFCNFLALQPFVSQHRPADYHGSDYASEICKQTRRDCMSRLFYADGSKVNRRDIKRGLRASINGCRSQTDDVVGPETMHNVREQSERRAPAQRSH